MVRGVRVSRIMLFKSREYVTKKTLNVCYKVVSVVHYVPKTGRKGGLFWGTKKVFFHFFSKKNSHSVSQFCVKITKKRHKCVILLIFNALSGHFNYIFEKTASCLFSEKCK